jgi:hypothetical protein
MGKGQPGVYTRRQRTKRLRRREEQNRSDTVVSPKSLPLSVFVAVLVAYDVDVDDDMNDSL